MIGSILLGTTFGVLRGISTYGQGKNIIKAGRNIEKIYEKLGENKILFENSFKEQKETAWRIKGFQEESAKAQYERNKTLVKKALESNLRNVMNQYVVENENLDGQVREMKSKILLTTGNKNVEENSIRNDSLSTLQNEFIENQRILNQNQMNMVEGVTEEGIAKEYQVGTDYDNVSSNIRQAYNRTIGNTELQRNQDISNLNQTIENGRISSASMQQQGYGIMAQAESSIANTLWSAGLNAFSSVGGFDWASNKIGSFFNKTSNIGSFENSLKTFGQRNPFGNREIYYKTYGGLPYKFGRGVKL